MNTLLNLYNWLIPSVPFEFIKARAADECASLLESRAGMRSGAFLQRLRVDVIADTDRGYSFLISPRIGGYFVIEARGTISSLADSYSQIEGIARTRPTLAAIFMFCFGLVIYSIIMISIIFAMFKSNAFPSSLIPIGVIAILLIASILIQIRFQKWFMSSYTDMVLGLLLRSL